MITKNSANNLALERLIKRIVWSTGFQEVPVSLDCQDKSKDVDMVVTEMTMPGMGGIELMNEHNSVSPCLFGLLSFRSLAKELK